MNGITTKLTRSRLQSLATAQAAFAPDRAGGKFAAGMIPNVSAITKGEALGHGFWIDEVFLQSVAAALTAAGDGSKCRFTHPSLCADGLAKGLGLAFGGRVQGDQVITDLHFYASAHKSPDGDLAGYVMDRAAEDPKHFGTSIVFISDMEAEKQFMLENGGVVVVHDDGWGTYETIEGFQSPDPANVDNLPHCRLFEFLGVDVVDDPAANPHGLFHRDLSTITEAEGVLDFVLGFSEQRPTTVSFGVDPDRAKQFVLSWAARRGLSLPEKGNPMAKLLKKGKLAAGNPGSDSNKPADQGGGNPPPGEGGGDQTPEGAVTCPDCGAVFMPDTKAEDQPPQDPSAYAAAHQRYVAAFGAEHGSKWFFDKVSFEAAQSLHFKAQLDAKDEEIKTLTAKLTEAETKLAAVANAGTNPLDSSPPPKGTEGGSDKGQGGFASLFNVKK